MTVSNLLLSNLIDYSSETSSVSSPRTLISHVQRYNLTELFCLRQAAATTLTHSARFTSYSEVPNIVSVLLQNEAAKWVCKQDLTPSAQATGGQSMSQASLDHSDKPAPPIMAASSERSMARRWEQSWDKVFADIKAQMDDIQTKKPKKEAATTPLLIDVSPKSSDGHMAPATATDVFMMGNTVSVSPVKNDNVGPKTPTKNVRVASALDHQGMSSKKSPQAVFPREVALHAQDPTTPVKVKLPKRETGKGLSESLWAPSLSGTPLSAYSNENVSREPETPKLDCFMAGKAGINAPKPMADITNKDRKMSADPFGGAFDAKNFLKNFDSKAYSGGSPRAKLASAVAKSSVGSVSGDLPDVPLIKPMNDVALKTPAENGPVFMSDIIKDLTRKSVDSIKTAPGGFHNDAAIRDIRDHTIRSLASSGAGEMQKSGIAAAKDSSTQEAAAFEPRSAFSSSSSEFSASEEVVSLADKPGPTPAKWFASKKNTIPEHFERPAARYYTTLPGMLSQSPEQSLGLQRVVPSAPTNTGIDHNKAFQGTNSQNTFIPATFVPALAENDVYTKGPVNLYIGGERALQTAVGTLMNKSAYFRQQFATGMVPKDSQGSYMVFLDTDPKVFDHILQYMRRGTMPMLYINGDFDTAMYAKVRDEAKFLGIEKLVDWIEGKSYRIMKSTWEQ